jgi:Pectate lyase superfamily protein
MFLRCTLLLLLSAAGQTFCQTTTSLNLGTQTHNPDFSNFAFTRPITVGSALPATCQIGQMFFDTAAAPGQNIFGCVQPNAWAEFGTLPVASSTALGGISIGAASGLQVAAGALSVAYGTSANSALQGNTLAQPNGPASLDSNGKIPILQLGNLGSAAFVSSTAFDAAGAAATAVSSIPQSGSTMTRAALITPADWTTFNSKQSALGFTPENSLNKNAKGGYAGLDANGFFPWVQISGIVTANHLQAGILSASDWNTFNAKQAPLGFTAENLANKGQIGGYAALNTSGQVPLTQLPTIPTKTSQLTNDASFVNSAQAGSAAPVQSVNGLTGAVSLVVPTKVSQVTNDSGYVTASTSPVTSVNGATGAVTVTTGNASAIQANAVRPGTPSAGQTYLWNATNNDFELGLPVAQAYSTVQANGTNAPQRSKLNIAAGANATVTVSDNGTDTTTLTISASSGSGGSVTSGNTAPSATTCSSTKIGAMYEQTGTTNNSSSAYFYVCSTDGNTNYHWTLVTGPQVNVMSFGCHGDGVTDDHACFQSAINFANTLNDYGGNFSPQSAAVYIPNGRYAIGSPIILPREGNAPSSSYAHGTVDIIGESSNGVILKGVGSTSNWFPGGSGAGKFAGMIQWATTAGDFASLRKIVGQKIKHLTFIPPAIDHTGSIYYQTWQTPPRTTTNLERERLEEPEFEDLRFYDSNTYNPWSIYIAGDSLSGHFRDLFCDPNQGTGQINYETVCLMTDTDWFGNTANEETGIQFSDVENISAGNGAGGWSMAFQGRGNHTTFSNFHCDGSLGAFSPPWINVQNPSSGAVFTNTPGVGGSQCYAWINSWAITVNNISNEGKAGPEIFMQNVMGSNFHNFTVAPARNEGAPSYTLGDGVDLIASSNNSFDTMPQTAFLFQAWAGMQSISNPVITNGGSGYTSVPTVTFSIGGSQPFCLTTPRANATISNGAVTGIVITNTGACPNASYGGGPVSMSIAPPPSGTQATGTVQSAVAGAAMLRLDAQSHNNTFTNLEQMGTADVVFADLTTNVALWCDSTSTAAGTCGLPQVLGYQAGVSSSPGTGPKPTCNTATRGAFWTARGGSGVADHVQVCAQTGSGTTLNWQQIF